MSRRFAVLIAGAVLAVLIAGGVVATAPGRTLVRSALRRINPPAVQPTTWAQSPPPRLVTINVDPTKLGRPISRLIYGLAHASADEVAATGATLNRWGGNPNTRYNWEVGSAWNAARDWQFQNYGDDQGVAANKPSGVADGFIAANRDQRLASVLTVPSMGWVARDGRREHASVNVPDDGGPPLPDGSDGAIAGYDPSINRSTTSVRSEPRKNAPFNDPPRLNDRVVYQDEWISHLVHTFGPTGAGGVQFYAIDNEPDLWSYTHTDVHPAQLSYADELYQFLDYADAIKDVDPTAQILGPTLSGWTGIFYSPLDRGDDRYRTHADRLAHGDMPLLPWWLQQVEEHDRETGRRSLDVLDVHFYPQANGVFRGFTDEATNRIRIRSTRALWDPTYVDESWINEPVQLIPRLRSWVETYYPGTRLGIGEWNWGSDTTMNGAIAIANVLGVFGREGVDLAAYWTSPPATSVGARAFAMYTNYDGAGGHFGDTSIDATSSAPDEVQVFGSIDSQTGDPIIVVTNARPDTALPASIKVRGADTGLARAYQLSAASPTRIVAKEPDDLTSGQLQLVLPAESITVIRFEFGPSTSR